MARPLAQLLMPLLLAVAFSLGGCEKSVATTTLRGETMGTYWQVKVAATLDSGQQETLRTAVEKRLAEVNAAMSTYIPSSEISQFNQSTSLEPREISADFAKVVARALQISAQTDGLYDITVMPLVNLWGFGYEKKGSQRPSAEALQAALATVGVDKIQLAGQRLRKLNPRTSIDLSSIAKGFGVDVVAATVEGLGHGDYLVEIGGEVRAGGDKRGQGWQLGIETPLVQSQPSTSLVIALREKTSVATSGNYRNFIDYDGQRAVHTINPKTGQPQQSALLSATVVAEDCMSADGYATALMILGDKAEALAREQNLAVLLIYADGERNFRLWRSPEFIKHFGD